MDHGINESSTEPTSSNYVSSNPDHPRTQSSKIRSSRSRPVLPSSTDSDSNSKCSSKKSPRRPMRSVDKSLDDYIEEKRKTKKKSRRDYAEKSQKRLEKQNSGGGSPDLRDKLSKRKFSEVVNGLSESEPDRQDVDYWGMKAASKRSHESIPTRKVDNFRRDPSPSDSTISAVEKRGAVVSSLESSGASGRRSFSGGADNPFSVSIKNSGTSSAKGQEKFLNIPDGAVKNWRGKYKALVNRHTKTEKLLEYAKAEASELKSSRDDALRERDLAREETVYFKNMSTQQQYTINQLMMQLNLRGNSSYVHSAPKLMAQAQQPQQTTTMAQVSVPSNPTTIVYANPAFQMPNSGQ